MVFFCEFVHINLSFLKSKMKVAITPKLYLYFQSIPLGLITIPFGTSFLLNVFATDNLGGQVQTWLS